MGQLVTIKTKKGTLTSNGSVEVCQDESKKTVVVSGSARSAQVVRRNSGSISLNRNTKNIVLKPGSTPEVSIKNIVSSPGVNVKFYSDPYYVAQSELFMYYSWHSVSDSTWMARRVHVDTFEEVEITGADPQPQTLEDFESLNFTE